MKPYRRNNQKIVIKNWRKADSEKNAMLTPYAWFGHVARVSDLLKIAKKIANSNLPKRIKDVIAKKLL